MKTALARLERVNLREAWKHEAGEFTPWLAQDDNLQLLAQALGLSEIELVATEHPVGDFKVDILCSDDDGEIIIENQLEPTDHRHLGQIVTYAAGVDAKKVIWVAESFRPEHLAALEFLNQNTTGSLNFFAAEIELWRIAESPLAPSFNVVVKPNDWSKSGREVARAATTATPVKQMQLRFWQGYVAYLQNKRSVLRPHTPRPHLCSLTKILAALEFGNWVTESVQAIGHIVHFIDRQQTDNLASLWVSKWLQSRRFISWMGREPENRLLWRHNAGFGGEKYAGLFDEFVFLSGRVMPSNHGEVRSVALKKDSPRVYGMLSEKLSSSELPEPSCLQCRGGEIPLTCSSKNRAAVSRARNSSMP
ncbi:hypothetical protein [Ralstonia pickettii]|uniref:hypothetical protein n=1 Tax=Ralstonia pickettii TaxID=329 RepID=UPI0020330BA1|nr:hypothetical protein [Ralstonia pickettii]